MDMDPAKLALIKKLLEMQNQTGIELPEVNPEGATQLGPIENDMAPPLQTGMGRAREYMGRPGVNTEMLDIKQPMMLPQDAIQNLIGVLPGDEPVGRGPISIDEKAKAFHKKGKK